MKHFYKNEVAEESTFFSSDFFLDSSAFISIHSYMISLISLFGHFVTFHLIYMKHLYLKFIVKGEETVDQMVEKFVH